MASWLVLWSLDRATRVPESWSGTLSCVLGQDTLLTQYRRPTACVASVSVQFGSKELQVRAGKIPKTPFLGLSLLPNSTETLATQARRPNAGGNPAMD